MVSVYRTNQGWTYHVPAKTGYYNSLVEVMTIRRAGPSSGYQTKQQLWRRSVSAEATHGCILGAYHTAVGQFDPRYPNQLRPQQR